MKFINSIFLKIFTILTGKHWDVTRFEFNLIKSDFKRLIERFHETEDWHKNVMCAMAFDKGLVMEVAADLKNASIENAEWLNFEYLGDHLCVCADESTDYNEATDTWTPPSAHYDFCIRFRNAINNYRDLKKMNVGVRCKGGFGRVHTTQSEADLCDLQTAMDEADYGF